MPMLNVELKTWSCPLPVLKVHCAPATSRELTSPKGADANNGELGSSGSARTALREVPRTRTRTHPRAINRARVVEVETRMPAPSRLWPPDEMSRQPAKCKRDRHV